jgi:hypothetical protein
VKEVKCLRKDDKRQITAVVSSTASGELVPLQLVVQGKTEAVVPKDEDAKRAVAAGSHLTMSENHWSNFVTMKSFVEKVLDPWRVKKCEELGLAPDSQKMVWLIDCWKVHIWRALGSGCLTCFPSSRRCSSLQIALASFRWQMLYYSDLSSIAFGNSLTLSRHKKWLSRSWARWNLRTSS